MYRTALLLLLAGLTTPHAALASPGIGGGRPAECNALPGERGANVWERAKIPELQRYCDLLASGAAKLSPGSMLARDVVKIAQQAEELVPGRAAPKLLEGRALSQMAEYPKALAAFARAKERDARALDDPTALLSWARALSFTGDDAGARDAFRALLPRTSVLPIADRAVAYLAAGVLIMATGPAGLDETIAILRQGRRDSLDVLRSASTLALALAIDRAGDVGEAAAVLAEEGIANPTSIVESPRVVDAMGRLGAAELPAMRAIALEAAGKREAARAAWQAYLTATPRGVWEAHARAHLTPGARPGRPLAAGHP